MIGQFSNLDLTWYEIEDLEDLCEEYPGFSSMNKEDLDKLATKLYWKASGMIDQANRLKDKSEAIRIYLRALERVTE